MIDLLDFQNEFRIYKFLTRHFYYYFATYDVGTSNNDLFFHFAKTLCNFLLNYNKNYKKLYFATV